MKVERHGYKFTDKRNTKGGIFSIICGILAVIMIFTGIIISYKAEGNADINVGLIGAGAFLLSAFGLIYAMLSFKEKDRFYVFSWVGCILNGIIWLLLCAIIAWGFIG